MTCVAAIWLASAGANPDAPGPQPEVPAAKPVETTVVWYDTTELIRLMEPENPVGDNQIASKIEGDEIRKQVMDFVDNSSWRDNGGVIGNASIIGRNLVVTQTPENQEKVKTFLAKLQKQLMPQLGETITLDAYWLRLTPAQLKAGQTTVPEALLSDAGSLYARARAVGFNGQAVTANVKDVQNVVKSATPVIAPGVAMYDYTTEPMEFGVSLTETPVHAEGEATVVVSFDSTLTMRSGGGTVVAVPTTQPEVADAEAQHALASGGRIEQSINSSVRLTPGVPAVVGGMSDRPGATDGKTMCLVLVASVTEAGK